MWTVPIPKAGPQPEPSLRENPDRLEPPARSEEAEVPLAAPGSHWGALDPRSLVQDPGLGFGQSDQPGGGRPVYVLGGGELAVGDQTLGQENPPKEPEGWEKGRQQPTPRHQDQEKGRTCLSPSAQGSPTCPQKGQCPEQGLCQQLRFVTRNSVSAPPWKGSLNKVKITVSFEDGNEKGWNCKGHSRFSGPLFQ